MTGDRKTQKSILSEDRFGNAMLVTAFAVVALNLFMTSYVCWVYERASAALANSEIALPGPASTPDSTHELILYVKEGGILYFDGKSVSRDSFKRLIQTNAGKRLVVRADRSVRWADMKQVMQFLADCGVKDITYSVIN